MRQTVTASARRAEKVTVYEPRQTPEQDEVILEEFVLMAGESRDIEVQSATAGVRTTVLTADENREWAKELGMENERKEETVRERMEREDEERLACTPRLANAEQIEEEVNAGKAAAKEREQFAQKEEKRTSKSDQRREAANRGEKSQRGQQATAENTPKPTK